MHHDLQTVIARVARLRDGVASAAPTELLLAQIDDVLSGGYARALDADAWSIAAEQRLHELIGDPLAPVRGPALRALASQHAGLQRDLIALRAELAALWRERDRLAAGALTAST